MIRVRLVRKDDLARDYGTTDSVVGLERYLNDMEGNGFTVLTLAETGMSFRVVFKVDPVPSHIDKTETPNPRA